MWTRFYNKRKFWCTDVLGSTSKWCELVATFIWTIQMSHFGELQNLIIFQNIFNRPFFITVQTPWISFDVVFSWPAAADPGFHMRGINPKWDANPKGGIPYLLFGKNVPKTSYKWRKLDRGVIRHWSVII